MKMKIKPLHDHVILKLINDVKTSSGGIVIPDTAAEKSTRGEVIAVGSGKYNKNGELQPMIVKEGDEVLFRKYSGTDVKIDGENYIVLKEEDIIGIVEA